MTTTHLYDISYPTKTALLRPYMSTIISSVFDAIVEHYSLTTVKNAEFSGIYRASISFEQVAEVIQMCNPRLKVNLSELPGVGALENPVLICGEPGSEITPHVHDGTDALAYGILGYANTIVSNHLEVLLPLEHVHFPKGVTHTLTMGKIGCLFLALSQKPIIDGEVVKDMRPIT